MPKGWHRPFDDGIKNERLRSKLRADSWKIQTERKRTLRGTERLCDECHKWYRYDEPETWCQHLRQIPDDTIDAPTVQTFKPYFNPNIQQGGAWIETRAKERECMRLNNREFNQ